jgi:hypothetical protein
MDWVFSRSQRTTSWEKPGSITVDGSFAIFFSPGQVMLGAHLGLHLASVVAWRFHQHQVPSFSKDPFQSSHGWSGWSTICDLMLGRNSILDSNGSRLFSAGRPLGTRKNSVHCLWFLCCCTQTLHRIPFGTSSYFLQAMTEARCNPKCAPSITWPGEKKIAKLQLFNTYTFPGEHYRSVKRPRYVIFNITTLHMCKG